MIYCFVFLQWKTKLEILWNFEIHIIHRKSYKDIDYRKVVTKYILYHITYIFSLVFCFSFNRILLKIALEWEHIISPKSEIVFALLPLLLFCCSFKVILPHEKQWTILWNSESDYAILETTRSSRSQAKGSTFFIQFFTMESQYQYSYILIFIFQT